LVAVVAVVAHKLLVLPVVAAAVLADIDHLY
jgi:hypothetical protein